MRVTDQRQWELGQFIQPGNFGTPCWPPETLLSLLCQLGEIVRLSLELICGFLENTWCHLSIHNLAPSELAQKVLYVRNLKGNLEKRDTSNRVVVIAGGWGEEEFPMLNQTWRMEGRADLRLVSRTVRSMQEFWSGTAALMAA